MFPKIIGPINSYGLMIMIGFLLATYLALKRLRRLPWKLDPDDPGVSKAIADEVVRRKLLESATVERLRDEAERAGEQFKASALVERKSLTSEQLEEMTRLAHGRRTSDFVLDLAIISMIFGLLGGKLTYIVQNWSTYAESMKLFDVSDGVHPLGAFLGLLPFGVYWLSTRKQKIDLVRSKKTLALILVTTLAFALIGVRGLYLWKNSGAYPSYTWRVLTTWQSGFVLYGGILLGVAAGIAYTRIRRMPVLVVGDIAAPSMMLGVAFGRLGCFLNGCCYGTVCDSFWCVRFPKWADLSGSPAYNHHRDQGLLVGDTGWSLPVHPTQLYEAAVAVLLFFAMSRLLRKVKYDGLVLAGTLMGYAAWRFFVEFLRGDPGREPFGAGELSFSQTVSIAVFILAVAGVFVILKKKPRVFAEGS
jgi:phosphatidylglycerol:prolipoprotein diacylglycerol transferase